MAATFPEKAAAMLLQMADEIDPLHAVRRNGSRSTGRLSSTADFAAAPRGKNLCFVIQHGRDRRGVAPMRVVA